MSSERLTDSRDRTWTPGAALGRGTWGRSRLIRDEHGRVAVLKEPLDEHDFPDQEVDRSALIDVCRACAEEQARLLDDAELPFLPRLDSTVALDQGRTGLIIPRFDVSLHQRMRTGLTVEEAMELVVHVAGQLAEARRVHGNLRPTNVLFDDEGHIVLTDLATPAIRTHRKQLVELAMGQAWSPPEADDHASGTWDTWALAQVLHAACHAPSVVDPPPPPRLASGGIDKAALATLKERVHARLADEGANPRFRDRVADRLGALLSRALSVQMQPSPPYRFADGEAFAERVREVLALVRPHVVDVGRIQFPGRADDATFRGDDPVEFTVTVACTQGVTDHEDLVCGIQLTDLDAVDGGRVPVHEATFAVQVHPSGRLRYKLGLPRLEPGRYGVRVAFAIKESGDSPRAVQSDLEVRPLPGWVPPRRDAPPAPLPFPVPSPAATSSRPADVAAAHDLPFDDVDGGEWAGEGPRPRPIPTPVAPPVGDDEDVDPLYEPRGLSDPRHAAARRDDHDDVGEPTAIRTVRPVELADPDDDGRVPNAGEELPSFAPPPGSSGAGALSRLAVALKNDSTLAVGIALGACLALVALISVLMQAC